MTELAVLVPESPDEAASLFGDGAGVTVVGGGTIVIPELSLGSVRPERALWLGRAGLDATVRQGGRVTIGAGATLTSIADLPAPLGPAIAHVADIEIRGQATLGGNVCAANADAPRGDLQGALIALGATARSTGAGGERSEPIEDFLRARSGRLLLDVAFDEPAAGAYAFLDRLHTHEYTAMAVSAVRTASGAIRLAATGAGPHGLRLPSAEAVAADPEAAGQAALGDVQLYDDALASAWYRGRTLPVLVRRALAQLGEDA